MLTCWPLVPCPLQEKRLLKQWTGMSDSTAETVSPVTRVVSVSNFETYYCFVWPAGLVIIPVGGRNDTGITDAKYNRGQAGYFIFKCYQFAPSAHTNLPATNSDKKRHNKYVLYMDLFSVLLILLSWLQDIMIPLSHDSPNFTRRSIATKKSLARLRSLSTMSSFARSFSRLNTSLLECPEVDQEEEVGCTVWFRFRLILSMGRMG